jgi:type IV secretion system protein VirB9
MTRRLRPLAVVCALALASACATLPPANDISPTAPGASATGDLRSGLAFAQGLTQDAAGAASDDLLPPAAREPRPPPRAHTRAVAPLTAIRTANAQARRSPDADSFVDATQIYDYAPGALYEVYAAPGFLSTIELEPGEAIATVAAGDTTRWMVEEAVTGEAGAPRAILLLKPTRANIRTNIVLVTDRRTYLIEAIAVAGQNYSAQVAWRYPDDSGGRSAAIVGPVDLEAVNFRYSIRTIRGHTPRWRPIRVFDDGRRTYVEFPLDIGASEAPPLFLINGTEAQLVNYRVAGNRYVVDRLFDVAELRLGARRQTIVRITREQRRPTLFSRRAP